MNRARDSCLHRLSALYPAARCCTMSALPERARRCRGAAEAAPPLRERLRAGKAALLEQFRAARTY